MIVMKGYDGLLKTIRGLPLQISHPLLQSINYDALKPFVRAAYFAAPLLSGRTAASVGTIKPGIKRAKEIGLVISGPRRGRFGGNVAHLNEFGTKDRYAKSGGYRGRMKKKPFIAPSWEQTKGQVLENIRLNTGKIISNYMKRTLKQYG